MTDGSLPLTEPGESTLHTSDAFRVLDVSRMTAWLAAYPLVTLVSPMTVVIHAPRWHR